eukprot:COSAG01_NODE_214_length_21729_cov_684.831623_14_plen_214_part_00
MRGKGKKQLEQKCGGDAAEIMLVHAVAVPSASRAPPATHERPVATHEQRPAPPPPPPPKSHNISNDNISNISRHRRQLIAAAWPVRRTAALWAGQQRSLPAPRSTRRTRPIPAPDNHGNHVGLQATLVTIRRDAAGISLVVAAREGVRLPLNPRKGVAAHHLRPCRSSAAGQNRCAEWWRDWGAAHPPPPSPPAALRPQRIGKGAVNHPALQG